MNHSKEHAGINQQELESRCRDIAAAAGVEPATCSVRKLSPAEALSVKLPIPWTGKVRPADKNELTPILFNQLQDFGLATSEIETLFGYSLNCIYPFLKRNGIKPKPIYPGRVLTRPPKSASKKNSPWHLRGH